MNSKHVFINCPFDDAYYPLLKGIFFTLLYLNFKPKIAETSDSGDIRLIKIKDLMMDSKLSIHDLSRIDPLHTNEYPRMNMPFECGIDFGLKLSGLNGYSEKKFLILEKETYRYRKVLSDISGNDIRAHQNDTEQVVKAVRDWIRVFSNSIPRHREIYLALNEFTGFYEDTLENENYDPSSITALTFSDTLEIMMDWIKKYKKFRSNPS
ncbi:hypothetical protein PBT90_07850 [Algoriphagus halophytocola]|uniref:Uncharacterized protein n=1 Tax=Algoriphagus halophytocola TaxID=2991499 RepID=A0ABY6MIK2_9BACT|nr:MULTISPECIES: hypothetical protein [unclassified Algoriphagus]UZD23299.1 hypothetical protein OM944_02165 [Algoriphagus sp. TR-M5]WBL44593.1 hypothetical protein PBT90_07850 [Algoriphagus sp. TR-M9]